MQRIAQAYLIFRLTHSGLAVGILAMAQFAPFSLFGLFAGTIVDRVNAHRMVIWTQTAQMTLASVLAGIVLSGAVQPWHVYTVAALNGALMVFDAPSRQALTYRMVGLSDLSNAVALNSSMFNAARIIGPAVAGALIASVGVGWCFTLNAASFLAVLGGLFLMRPSEFHPIVRSQRPSILRGTREGLAYVWRDRRAAIVLALVVVVSTFCFNYNVVLPVLAARTLHSENGSLFGLLSAIFGAGALVGALVSAAQRRATLRGILVGAVLFAGSELALAPQTSIPLVAALLFTTGVGFTVWTSNSNASLQLAAPDHLRGRVIGLYYYAFSGTGPLGGILMGWLCDRGGTRLALLVAGSAGLAGIAAAVVWLRPVRRAGQKLRAGPEHARAA